MLVLAISLFTALFITLVKESRKDWENMAGAIEVGLALAFVIGMTVFVIVFDYQTSHANVYTTNDFTFVYSTESEAKRVKFIDACGREQDLTFWSTSKTIGGSPTFEIKDENSLTYKMLANKKKTCTIEYLCITKELADEVEYPYEKTLEASTTTKGD